MKLAILFDGLEIPPKNGVTYRFYYLTKFLKKNGIDVTVLLCDRGFINIDSLKVSGLSIHLFSPDKFYKDLPFVQNIIEKVSPDILQVNNCQSVLWFGAKYSQNLRVPLITEMHDVDATLKRSLGANKETVDKMKFVQYAAGIFSSEIVSTTSQDQDELEKIGIEKAKINLIPNGIDGDFFSYSGPKLSNRQLVFLGNMFYEPNKNAAERIIKEVIPKVNAKLVCIGMVDEQFKEKNSSDNVSFTGPLDDIRPILKESSIAVAPIFEGSGMKVKILNFAAAGLPIITTKMGISGYPREIAIVEQDLKKYPEIINDLLLSENKVRQWTLANREAITKCYSWESIAEKTKGVYEKARFEKISGTLITKNLATQLSDHSSKLIFKTHCPLPIWLEESRIKYGKTQFDYLKIN